MGTESLDRPVDGASLAAFRVIFGVLMFGSTVRFMAKGWIDQLYLAPVRHFSFYGFSWVRPWPGVGLHAHFAALASLALCIAIGWRPRLCTALFFLGFAYVELLDKAAYLNHYYLVSTLLFVMLFLPLWGAAKVPCWALWALRLQLGLVYFYAGVAKLHPDWLLDAQPLRIWLAARTHVPLIGPWLDQTWAAYLFSWTGAAFDLTIPFFLLGRRSRPFAYAAVVLFHGTTALLFPIGLFPWLMIGCTTIFFEPDWPRRFVGSRLAADPAASSPRASGSAWLTAVLAGHFLFQILFPLRHWLYPGDRMWTEEGFRFAWHVMVKQKTGLVDFYVTDPETGRTSLVDLRAMLTPFQLEMMSAEPDMILQCAHWVAEDYRRKGQARVEVRAQAYAALNGRRGQLLIDPQVDLAHEPISLWPKSWILPEGE